MRKELEITHEIIAENDTTYFVDFCLAVKRW